MTFQFSKKFSLSNCSNLPEGIRPQLLSLIEQVFLYDKANAQCLVLDILACVRQKHMVIFYKTAIISFVVKSNELIIPYSQNFTYIVIIPVMLA